MSQSSPLNFVAAAAGAFVAEILPKAPRRVEAKVASHNGMPLLCVVEEVFGQALPQQTAQELVWLSGAPRPGAHVLRFQAFGPGNQLLAEILHEFEG